MSGGTINKKAIGQLPVAGDPSEIIFHRSNSEDFRASFKAGNFYTAVVTVRWVSEVILTDEQNSKNPMSSKLKVNAGDPDGNSSSTSGDVSASPGWLIDQESIAFLAPQVDETVCDASGY